jgi:hypothetical protein
MGRRKKERRGYGQTYPLEAAGAAMAPLARVDRMDDEAIRVAFPREQPRKSGGTGTKQKVYYAFPS